MSNRSPVQHPPATLIQAAPSQPDPVTPYISMTGKEPLQLFEEGEAPRRAGRYHLLEVLARGGMGEVYRAHDPDLDRELAVKILAVRDASDDLPRRFLDEARICGQLQHPGIVPIHELGILPDGRPFFAMKLIQGQTLTQLLAACPRPHLASLVEIFERICQTVAYAHARGVIHRDLKPSNIMVGAFGEVQVMDWGLARLLSRTETWEPSTPPESPPLYLPTSGELTRIGSVVGTPGYMAPEQAEAQRDIDERADVFALGAILCEMLTGEPPYGHPENSGMYIRSHLGLLGPAHARLQDCGGPAELIALARRCLALEREGRPRHAGEVADALHQYQQDVQQQVRQAEIDRERAHSNRRVRRALLGLGLVILCACLGGWLARARLVQFAEQAAEERRTRVQHLHRQASAALTEAHLLQAEAGRMHNAPDAWASALARARAACQRGQSILESVDPADPLLQKAGTLASSLESDERDRQLAHALVQAGLRRIAVREEVFDTAGATRAYEQVFRDHDLDVLTLTEEEAARRIRGRSIQPELIEALENWGHLLADQPSRRDRLLAIASLVDSDPIRKRFRCAIAERETRTLMVLSARESTLNLPPSSIVVLANELAGLGELEQALKLLLRARELHPCNFWINFGLGHGMQSLGKEEEALRFYTVAATLRQDSPGLYLNLGLVLQRLGRQPEAEQAIRRAITLKPDFHAAYNNLGWALLEQGRFDEARAQFLEAVALAPRQPVVLVGLGMVANEMKEFARAEMYFRAAIGEGEGKADYWRLLARAVQCQGRHREARSIYRHALRLWPDNARLREFYEADRER